MGLGGSGWFLVRPNGSFSITGSRPLILADVLTFLDCDSYLPPSDGVKSVCDKGVEVGRA